MNFMFRFPFYLCLKSGNWLIVCLQEKILVLIFPISGNLGLENLRTLQLDSIILQRPQVLMEGACNSLFYYVINRVRGFDVSWQFASTPSGFLRGVDRVFASC